MTSLSQVRLFATPWTVAYQAPPSKGFSRQGCWSGLSEASPEDLPDSGIEPGSPALRADASEPPGSLLGRSLLLLLFHNRPGPPRWLNIELSSPHPEGAAGGPADSCSPAHCPAGPHQPLLPRHQAVGRLPRLSSSRRRLLAEGCPAAGTPSSSSRGGAGAGGPEASGLSGEAGVSGDRKSVV